MTDLCITPACQRRAEPRPAADGLRVCQSETDLFLAHCTAIPGLWAPYSDDDALFPTKRDHGRAAPGIVSSSPIDLTVSAMRDIRTSWEQEGDLINPQRALAQIVARALYDSSGQHVHPERYPVAESCRILGRSRLTRWALAQDWAGLMVWTVKLVRDQLAMLGGERRARPVGQHDDCGGRLWPSPAGARCSGCGHEIGSVDLIRLGLAQHGVGT